MIKTVVRDRREYLAIVEGILNWLPSPVFVHSGGNVVLINDAFGAVFGIEASGHLGGPCRRLLAEIGLASSVADRIVEGGAFSNVECRSAPRGGPAILLVASQNELRSALKEPAAFHLVTMTDITWRRSVEEEGEALRHELREAQKLEAVGKLAGGIAHEINTPSQYIGDNLSFLSEAHQDLVAFSKMCLSAIDGLRDREEFSAVVAAIDRFRETKDIGYLIEEIPPAIAHSREGINQISGIVLAMKEFSHPSAKGKSLVDLNHALENVVTISRNEWKYVCRMETNLDPDLPSILGLPGELNQVFLNLVVNAAHAVGEAGHDTETGRIAVTTLVEHGCAVVRVTDNGTGIPDAIRDKIFTPFFTTKGIGKGTGQGLAITREIVVKRHEGVIGFETTPGQGTTFTVRLPIDGHAGPAGDEKRGGRDEGSGRPGPRVRRSRRG